mmetsp:Transcript_16624/g.21647  ORF Transcript_16624/g.21647 Transcript_16624/m.21647 type:complete len:83 (-) Transcript_16624:50-298(-)
MDDDDDVEMSRAHTTGTVPSSKRDTAVTIRTSPRENKKRRRRYGHDDDDDDGTSCISIADFICDDPATFTLPRPNSTERDRY